MEGGKTALARSLAGRGWDGMVAGGGGGGDGDVLVSLVWVGYGWGGIWILSCFAFYGGSWTKPYLILLSEDPP